ncbi:MAG TPA: AAA family ATPase, partial [Candidatus Saccharimonadales bacterium]|nr:AAA family ATPase [Candidatus Saccharimonadales bacterium]
ALAIQKNPSTVVLFDEVEKSHQFVKNVLLQVLDEGKLTANYGKVLDFTNAIIIATSNAGSDLIRRQVAAGIDVANFEKQLIDQLISEKIFLPEFLNRFDAVIVYRPLTAEEIVKVVGMQLAILEAQLKKDKGLNLEVAPAVVQELAKRGYDPVFGARALERVIKEDLETVIAKEIIAQQPQPGTTLTINSI